MFAGVRSCCVQLMTPCTAACQAFLSSSLLRCTSVESVMPSNHFIPTVPFSSCLQSFPASGSFPMSWLFTSGDRTIRVSASTSVLPINVQGWFPLDFTGLISLLPKGLSRMFSSTTAQKHQFFSAQPFLWSNSHICTWLLAKP